MFRKNLLLLSMNFVLQTKKSELTRSKLILTLQNGILSCNSALTIRVINSRSGTTGAQTRPVFYADKKGGVSYAIK